MFTSKPRWILAFWIVVFVASLPLASRVGEVLIAQPGLPLASDATTVARLIDEQFGAVGSDSVLILVRPQHDGEAGAEASEAFLADATGIAGVTEVHSLADRLPSLRSRSAFLGKVEFASSDPAAIKQAVADLRVLAEKYGEVQVALAGGHATGLELERVSKRDARRAELFGLPLALVILAVGFGALVASLVPLVVAVASVTVSLAAVWLIGQVFPFAVFTHSIVTMLGLATGIDYALLMVNRFREELRRGRSARDAAAVTSATAGRAVLFSGLTVMIALTALLVPPLPYIRTVGVGAMVVLAVSVIVSSSALPALLALLGPRVDMLKLTRRQPGLRTQRFWRRRAEAVMRRPWSWTILGSAVMLAVALPALGMRVADPGALGLARGSEARVVVAELDDAGLGGLLASVTVLIDSGEDGFFGPSTPRRASALARQLAGLENVGAVFSPFSVSGVPNLLLLQYYVDESLARGAEVAEVAVATVGSGGRYVRLQVVPSRDLAPAAAAELERRIQEAAVAAGFGARMGGSAAFEAEWSQVLYGAFPLALAIVVVATFALLGLAFRSVLIPLKSIVLNVLTVAAAYGVITAVFQDGFGASLFGLDGGLGYVDSNVPLFVFAIVFGLSMDYEVFLVARIYENHRAGLSDELAVANALAATGSVITSAAAVMLAVFGVFFFSEVVLIKTLGVGLFVAVLFDASLVRVAMVPAVMRLAGGANWWMPAWLRRLADRIDISH